MRARRRLIRCRNLDAQELAPDEHVVAVRELLLAPNLQVRPVPARHVGQDELGARVFDLAVGGAHVEVAWKVQVAALATDLKAPTTRAYRHAESPALEDLDDLEVRLMLRGRIKVGPVGGGSVVGLGRPFD